MNDLWFGLLGPTVVTGDGSEIAVPGVLRRKLLVRLLVSANRPVPVDRLRDDLWDGEPPASASSTLKSHVSLLRRSIGDERLSFRGGAYLIHVAPDELDVDQFVEDVRVGHDLLRSGDIAAAALILGRGLGRWRGAALVEVADSSWAIPEAVRLEELRAAALEGWFDARLGMGEAAAVVGDAEAAVAQHPLREGLWARLITALYGANRQADALRAYQRLRTVLGEELGIAPSPELVALEAAVLNQQLDVKAAVRRATREPSPSRPPGARVAASPPPAGRRAPADGNLPAERTSFVGRPKVLAALAEIVGRPGLVTLTGPGGTGKTRLALHVAGGAGRYDGRWFCDLSGLADSAPVAGELAAALGLGGGRADPLAAPVERLSDGTHLLVLDNCEHVLEQAAAVADRLVSACPALRVIATSRSPLGIESEVVFQVPPMSAPRADEGGDVEALVQFESVQLFCARAAAQRSGFVVDAATAPAVAAICAGLEGIPLALELAAARLRTMSVEDVERLLDDRLRLLSAGPRTAPTRQRTLRAMIDWSHDLMDEAERRAFGRLSVCVGGFDLDTAEAVVGADAFELVTSLVDRSLVQLDAGAPPGGPRGDGAGPSRYRMLEIVREYAVSALGRAGQEEEEDARRAHARRFLALAEEAAPQFSGPRQMVWRARLEPDHDNVRAALAHLAAAEGTGEEALRLGIAASRFWNSRGVYGDEVELLEAALARSDVQAPTELRAGALVAVGFLLFRRGEAHRARRQLQRGLRLAHELGSARLRADALRSLAWVADRMGETDAAVGFAAAAVEQALSSGERHLIARAYDVRAATAQDRDPKSARADYAEALRWCELAGDAPGRASTLNNLGVLEIEQGDPAAARVAFTEARSIAGAVGDAGLLPYLDYGLGLATVLVGEGGVAGAAFSGALAGARRTGQRALVPYALLGLAVVCAAAPPAPSAGSTGTRAGSGATGAGDGVGDVALATDAAMLLGAARGLFAELGVRPERTESSLDAAAEECFAAALGPELSGALARGAGLVPVDVFRLATEVAERFVGGHAGGAGGL